MIATNSTGSKCPNCQKTSFEAVLESPAKSAFSITFIRCSSCQTVVGVMEPANTVELLQRIIKKLNA